MQPLYQRQFQIDPRQSRHEIVFLTLAGIFLSTFALLNVLGLTRIIDLSFSLGSLHIPLILPLGVLPYPLTFILIDLITEFYGKKRARTVVWLGLIINMWIAFILWISAFLPPHITLDPLTHLPAITDPNFTFYQIRTYTMTGIIGSMTAYLVAQLLDVNIFQWCKNFTKGKHLWLRSNTSTLISQLVDTMIICSFNFYFTDAMDHLPGHHSLNLLFTLILSGYVFKAIATLLSTAPFYATVYFLRNFLNKSKENTPPFATDPQPLTT